MNVEDIKKRLEKDLPEFKFKTGEEAGQPERNWQSIQVTRDGVGFALDLKRVKNRADIRSVEKYITKQWSGYIKSKVA